jgi:hypothetical protein
MSCILKHSSTVYCRLLSFGYVVGRIAQMKIKLRYYPKKSIIISSNEKSNFSFLQVGKTVFNHYLCTAVCDAETLRTIE